MKLELNINGKNFIAWLSEQDGEHRVAVKPICEALGIDPWTQQNKLQSNPKFSCQHMLATGADAKQYEMLCIPVRQVSGWLYGINSRKVNPEIAPQLLAFQEQLQTVIWAHVKGDLTFEIVEKLRKMVDQLSMVVLQQSEQIEQQDYRIKQLEEQLDAQDRAGDYLAKSASYGMHAAKRTKHTRSIH